jgi:hypothetical protein
LTGLDLAILIPVLGRPERAAPVIESALAATPDAFVLFLTSPGDGAEQDAIDDAGGRFEVVPWDPGPGDYARKINYGFKLVTGRDPNWVPYAIPAVTISHEWVFLGADDLIFHPGWYEACLRRAASTRACVVGTNDLGNARTATGQHSTHTLVNAGYWECGTVDESNRILHEGYEHEYVDDELVHTARWRSTYAHCPEAIVEHLHPDWGKGVEDATYAKARAGRSRDTRLYKRREDAHWGARYGAGRRHR